MSLFDDLMGTPKNQYSKEERDFYVAQRYAGTGQSIKLSDLRQLKFFKSIEWGCIGERSEDGFMGDLDHCMRMLMLDELDPIAKMAIKLRCLVFGCASSDDFEKFKIKSRWPELFAENNNRFGWGNWSIGVFDWHEFRHALTREQAAIALTRQNLMSGDL